MKNKMNLGYILSVILLLSLALSAGCSSQPAASTSGDNSVYERPDTVTSADEAKQLLIDGNKRYTEGALANLDLGDTRRQELLEGQKPFATIISCSDSRVPPELLFDQGLGDIFTIRNAGNIIDSVTMGSVEYAVEHLQTPLLVVLGHEKCGAVTATVEGGEAPGSIGAIVQKIAPSVEKAKAAGASEEDLINNSIDENIKATIAELEKSPIVEHALENGKLTVVGAKYLLKSGEVEWFEDAE
ncbi:carbonic anhydrase [Desulfolucanica intricata]|uniref:carbonic anhydrase n=1 Tax=Desulfolucanica intricata TaxID=1285191 RepID=UPI000AD995DA|nr:carbonic anhydrase [Desulfolucanica intricata]